MDETKVSMIIPAYNEAQTLRRTWEEVMAQEIVESGYRIAEVSCPTKYFPESSSINLLPSIKYGFGCLDTAMKFRLAKMEIMSTELFPRHD